jgi:thiol-disulfide isomerase/thioredoxin
MLKRKKELILLFLCCVGLYIYSQYKPTIEKMTEKSIKIFNFNTSWCGWSQKFQPEWDKFAENAKTNVKLSNIDVIDIKCDDEKNKTICEEYNVPGYPYVVINDGNTKTEYKGSRNAESLTNNFLN